MAFLFESIVWSVLRFSVFVFHRNPATAAFFWISFQHQTTAIYCTPFPFLALSHNFVSIFDGVDTFSGDLILVLSYALVEQLRGYPQHQ
jgi:hypothetical protein